MFNFWHHHGILGINARNLLYIKPLNQAHIRFADDKLKTKHFLSARGIKTPRLLGKIRDERELINFDWETLPNDFVLKPNSGYGGEGIWILTSLPAAAGQPGIFAGKQKNGPPRRAGPPAGRAGWQTLDQKIVSKKTLLSHCQDILEGRYCITGERDTAFFEQRLVSHPEMGMMGKFGLPDIRIIVFNLVPVMAMVRVPTRQSAGKANLHGGGLGLGVDLAKGEITHMTLGSRFIKDHPDFESLKGLKIPFWEDILLLATQIQQMVTLGYLAVDIVVDAILGPTLLEINARAGLSVQTANLAPLRDRLDRVAGVKVNTPEKGVRLAQDLFGNKLERRIQALSGKKVIGLEEEVTLHLKKRSCSTIARMNPTISKNYLEAKLFQQLLAEGPRLFTTDQKEKLTLRCTLQGERMRAVFYPLEMSDDGPQMILGKKALTHFYLDVARQSQKIIQSIVDSPKSMDHRPSAAADHRLAEFDRRLSLISRVRPLNLEEERQRFFLSESYEPQFQYRPAPHQIHEITLSLQQVRIDLDTPLGQLFEEKRQELLRKTEIIAAIGDDQQFPEASLRLIGWPGEAIREAAQREFEPLQSEVSARSGEALRNFSTQEAIQMLRSALEERGLTHWQVEAKASLVARATIGKHRLFIRAGEFFSQEDMTKLIAHEIETHIYCLENAKLQPYLLFQRGTANALRTQEGLAVFHQNQHIPLGTSRALLAFQAVMWAKTLGFRAVFDQLREYLSADEAWSLAVKVKRGMSDTSKPGAFLKNALYYWGYCEVKDYLAKGGEFEDLFLGKISLYQLPLIKQIPRLQRPKYVPELRVQGSEFRVQGSGFRVKS